MNYRQWITFWPVCKQYTEKDKNWIEEFGQAPQGTHSLFSDTMQQQLCSDSISGVQDHSPCLVNSLQYRDEQISYVHVYINALYSGGQIKLP